MFSSCSPSTLRGVLHRAIDELDEAGDDGERAVDVVQDAGVDLAFGARHFLLHPLVAGSPAGVLQLLVGRVQNSTVGAVLLRGAATAARMVGMSKGLLR